MAAAVETLPRARPLRIRPVVGVLLPSAIAATLYGWMRLPVADDHLARYMQWCHRLAMRPQDWPCRLTEAQVTAPFVAASLLVALGLALPGIVLAASGRRLSALVPVGLAALVSVVVGYVSASGATSFFGISDPFMGSGDGRSFWLVHAAAAGAVDLVLVSVPALAIAYVLRPPRRARPAPLPRHASWLATLVIAGAVVAIRLLWSRVGSDVFQGGGSDAWVAGGTMAVFGAMLGTDRRWWPWALAPAATLLSLGPGIAVMSIPSNLTAFTWFQGVLPLALIGFVGSLSRPLAIRFAGERGAVSEPASTPWRSVRPTAVLNALAVALVAVSMLASRADPLPWQISTILPTYLGERALAEDVRTKLNLSGAIDALERYREEQGTFAGFDAATGEGFAAELPWADHPNHAPFVVSVENAGPSFARVVALSASGTEFCMRTDGRRSTFGSAPQIPGHGGGDVSGALGACGQTPVTPAAFGMIDVDAMCEGVDESGILICRAVQKLIRTTLASPSGR
jgi:hypothetical protein